MADREAKQTREGDLLLLPEAAALCRLSVSTLRWLRHRGEGPSGFKMGRRLMFRRTAVEAWISEHEQAQQ
jgi:predicted DNA-binding transcriptional regulator AlpA